MKKYGYSGEVIDSRLSPKYKIMNYLHENKEYIMNHFAFFDDFGKNEQFLNEKCYYCRIIEDVEETELLTTDFDKMNNETRKIKKQTSTYIDIQEIHEMESVDSDDDELKVA
ncbi:cytoadherence linked asexual protein 3.1, putative [Plasmodium sp. DRC-Itaito]|nr:cytoadherence linked asexual protein 3.1, putative [Plasmodium sp. DRC-Itaito]